MGKITINLVKFALVLLLFGVVALFAFWLPSLHGYVRELLSKADAQLYFLGNLFYPLSALISLPLIAIIGVAFRFPNAIERDEIFSSSTAKSLRLISNMMFISCIVGFISVALLFIIGERVLAPLLLFTFIVGCILALMLAVLSSYVKRAAILKEEVDHTL